MKARTTEQAARAAKISRASLQEWIRLGKIAAPPVQLVKGMRICQLVVETVFGTPSTSMAGMFQDQVSVSGKPSSSDTPTDE